MNASAIHNHFIEPAHRAVNTKRTTVTLSNPSGALAGDVDGDSDFDSLQDVRDHNHGNRSNWDVICDVGTSIKQTSVADALTNYRINGDADSDITFDPKVGDKLGPVMDPIIDPNETYDVAVQSLIDDMMTGFMKLDDIRGEFTTGGGGDSFNSWRDVRDHNYGKVINGPLYQPDALPDFSLTLHEQNPNSIHDKLGEFDAGENEKVDVTYRLKDVIITSFDNTDALTNYNPAKGASLKDIIDNDDTLPNYNPGKGASFGAEQGEGWIIIESMVNHDNMQGLDAGGMNYAEAVGLDSSVFHSPINNVGGSADPGGDDI